MTTLKKNVLIPISFNFQIRYIIRTGLLDKFSTFCNPIILLFWEQSDLIDELNNLGYPAYFFCPEGQKLDYIQLKNNVDFYYKKNILKSPTLKIREKIIWNQSSFKKKIKRSAWHLKHYFFYDSKKFNKDLIRIEKLINKSEDFSKLLNFFKDLNIQSVFTTAPFLYSEELVVRVASRIKIPIYYSVLSFDNLTTRGYIPLKAEHYFVWNKYNKSELMRIDQSLTQDKITITGPPQFDFYFKDRFVMNEREWRNIKGIPLNRPIILYGANAKCWIPNEQILVKYIDNCISLGKIQRSPVVLLRPHPTDSFVDWLEFAKSCKNVYIVKSLIKNQSENSINNKFSNFFLDDVINLCSTLEHSAVHISYASTLALDGACFNKPQICPFFAPSNSTCANKEIRALYFTEHYTPIRNSGAVDLPKNREELIKCINDAFLYPVQKSAERLQLLDQMITYRDGEATDRLAAKMEELLFMV